MQLLCFGGRKYYHRPCSKGREHAGRRRGPQSAVENHSRERPLPVDMSRRQQRIIDEECARTDGNGVDLRALMVGMTRGNK